MSLFPTYFYQLFYVTILWGFKGPCGVLLMDLWSLSTRSNQQGLFSGLCQMVFFPRGGPSNTAGPTLLGQHEDAFSGTFYAGFDLRLKSATNNGTC